MANISSVGIGSGVLTSDLIEKLVAAEREPTELRLNAKEESITTELSVFGQIQSAVTDFRLASRPLADPDLFQDLTLTSSNSAISGQADSSASTGTYSLEVTTLAASQSLSSAVFADSDTTAVGEGDLAITINGTTTNITIDSSNNTLEGIAAAINAEDDLGATASVLNVGSGYRLVITSDDTGADAAIEIAVTDTGDGMNGDASGLSQLSYTTGAFNLTENQAATDAAFKLNGVDITRSTNTISDVIQGVTFELSGTNENAPAKIEITRNTEQIVEKAQEFVDAYNSLQSLISENTKFNADNPAASGLLLGDTATRNILNQIQSLIGTTVQGLETANVRSLADMGILTNKDTGQLEFNQTQFEGMLEKDPFSVAGVFAEQGRTTDSQVEFVRAGINTTPGTYAINITQAATKGELTGTFALTGSTVIDGDNDEFTISIDGVSSASITLDAGTYTNEELAAEIQAKINSDSALSDAGKTVSVSVDGSNQLVITSDAFGSSSSVEITAVDTNSAAQLGLSVATGTDGLDVAGTINGVAGTGDGQYLNAATGDASESIRIKVSGSATGDRGTVSYIEGVGERMVDLINGFLGANGAITAKNERLNKQLEFVAEERINLEARITSLNDRLVRQFTSADIIVARLTSTQDFISQQLDAIVASNKQD